MKLAKLLEKLEILEANASLDMEVSGVAYDSRQVETGFAFVAIAGFATDGNKYIPMAAQKGAAQNGDDAVKDEKVIHPFRLSRGTTYYNQIREKLDCVFEKYPRDVRLKSIFPQSDWVLAEKMLIGIVYEEGRPRFLCVAVESTGEPPKEILEECVFVPRSHYTRDEGFYVVFQDADTGETVKTYRA